MTIRMPHNVLAGDIIHSVGASAPASPIPGTIWLDTSAPAQATPLVYGPNGEILLHASGQGSVGRLTRTAGPQEDVHLRSGDAAGSLAFVEGQAGTYQTANCYWDGTNWQRFDTSTSATIFYVTNAWTIAIGTAPAGANPIGTFTTTTLSRAQLDALISPPVVRAHRTGALDFPNGTWVAISWDAVSFDTHAMWSGAAPTRLTVPTGWSGYWDIQACIRYSPNATGVRYCSIRKTATTYWAQSIIPGAQVGSGVELMCSTLMALNAGDWIDVAGYQDSGVLLSAQFPDISTLHVDMSWRRGL